MKLRKFDVVLSYDFEWSKLDAAINYYINEMNKKGVNTVDIITIKNKLMFNSQVYEIAVDTPFINK